MINTKRLLLLGLVSILFGIQVSAQVSNKLEQGFATPPDSINLWCYNYWISDNVSKEGITRDLEAMKKFGIGAALIGNIGQPDIPYGKVKILTEPWWQATEHAIREGKRIGVEIGLFNCPGWSQSGGPWISSNEAMRYLAVSEEIVTGPATFKRKLKTPAQPFQDVALIAFPYNEAGKSTNSSIKPAVSVKPSCDNVSNIADGKLNTSMMFPKKEIASVFTFDFSFAKPFSAQSISLTAAKKEFYADCELMVKDARGNFNLVKKFVFNRRNASKDVGFIPYGPVTVAFPESFGKDFRLVVSKIVPKDTVSAGFSEIELSGNAVVESYIEKQLAKMSQTPFPLWDHYLWESQPEAINKSSYIDSEKVLDISKYLKDSVLTWTVPAGKWVIQRIGMTPTGAKNTPSAPNATGYEVDKMNKEMVAGHFDAYIGEVLRRMPAQDRTAFKYVVADSYEKGSQNWTNGLETDFKSRYGYDPISFLPVLSGRVVKSVERSNRFLWDLRRIVADRVAYDYVGGLREQCEKNNLKMWLENYGHWGFPGEFLQYGGQSNLVSGEFWNEGTLGNIECKAAVSSAHIYGKPRVSAEAFTSDTLTYKHHPALLKKRGDWAFTEGINHFVLHLYIHQPDEREPGINAWFSTEFNRHNVWFEQGKTYADYLRRCMFLLQQGKPVVDVAYFIGEDVPKMTGVRDPELPQGYSYDYINAEALMQRVSVRDGKMVFPDGFSCSILVLPKLKTMRPELLRKIKDLVSQGMIVFGPAPIQSPSLQNYPQCDVEVQQIAAELWRGKDSINYFGRGKIYCGKDFRAALLDANILPDVVLPEKPPVLWVHRSTPDAEIYFLTNQSDREVSLAPTFRVTDKQPEFWDAITGSKRILNQFIPLIGSTVVPLTLQPAQSGFIVFRNTNRKASVYSENFPKPKLISTIATPWEVDFEKEKRGPAQTVVFKTLTDWSLSTNDQIKYFSGTATYKNKFQNAGVEKGKRLLVDLGKVGVMARVKINGKEAGGVWIAPYIIDITDFAAIGENTIEIEVVNVWYNRLIGDRKLPESERKTWYSVDYFKNDILVPSGLLGPVTLKTVE